jgi:pescadillo protein
MLTFFEFYETLLGFVLYKLYGDLGVRYPLPTVVTDGGSGDGNIVSRATLHPTLGGKATSVLAANLSALQMALNEASKGSFAADAIKDAMQNEGAAPNVERGGSIATPKEDKKVTKANKRRQKALMQSIDEALKGVNQDDDGEGSGEDEDVDPDDEDQMPIAAPLREALEAIDDTDIAGDDNNNNIITDPEACKRHQLFGNLTFFLSREVPRGYLELIILAYGGKVGWEGQDSPLVMEDSTITHHVIDRPKLLPSYAKLPKSREYIQPQWILDCANFSFILPIRRYGVGSALPPHLSPWVDDKEEGYVPKYKEEVERLMNGEVLDYVSDDEAQAGRDMVGDDRASDEKEGSLSEEEKDENESKDDNSEHSEEEEDDDKAEQQALKKKITEDEEAAQLAKALMSKKSARLYGRMQHGIAQKQAKVDNLHKKRREIESTQEKSKDGKTTQKLKVERLKKERKDKEDAYAKAGGSMKKKRRHK